MKKSLDDLLNLMAALRDPETGCVWDKAQTCQSIVPHTLEEAYEVAEVIESGRLDELCDELGDLLFQIVFYARIAEEQQRFEFSDVVDAITRKMIRRHPHVFGNEQVGSVEEQMQLWQKLKQQEKARPAADNSALDGVNWHMPANSVASKLQNKAARVGFDWPDWHGPLAKVREELDELQHAVVSESPADMQDEMGDVLFASVNLARSLGIDPEAALRQTNRKFERRFRKMEQLAREENKEFSQLSIEEQEAYWQRVKQEFE